LSIIKKISLASVLEEREAYFCEDFDAELDDRGPDVAGDLRADVEKASGN
jgi:hypothetical protein